MKSNLDEFLIDENALLNDAISLLSSIKDRCLLVKTENGKLAGVLSEGDILRAFLSGATKFSPIADWITRDYKYLCEFNLKKALEMFKLYGISIIPIVDENANLVDLISLLEILDCMTISQN